MESEHPKRCWHCRRYQSQEGGQERYICSECLTEKRGQLALKKEALIKKLIRYLQRDCHDACLILSDKVRLCLEEYELLEDLS